MGGNGTFNLEKFFRQMGVKNPHPDMREFVQPVVVVGQFEGLTPRHQPPTYYGGGSIAGVAAEFSIIQITAVAPGGALLRQWNQASTHRFGMITRVAGLTVVPDRGPLSMEAAEAIVESGTDVADPMGADWPLVKVADANGFYPIYIPPGRTFGIAASFVDNGISAWSIIVEDVPAFENQPG